MYLYFILEINVIFEGNLKLTMELSLVCYYFRCFTPQHIDIIPLPASICAVGKLVEILMLSL